MRKCAYFCIKNIFFLHSLTLKGTFYFYISFCLIIYLSDVSYFWFVCLFDCLYVSLFYHLAIPFAPRGNLFLFPLNISFNGVFTYPSFKVQDDISRTLQGIQRWRMERAWPSFLSTSWKDFLLIIFSLTNHFHYIDR